MAKRFFTVVVRYDKTSDMVEFGDSKNPNDEERYNGWKNYQTWCVNLWLKNREEQEWRFRHMARTGTDVHDLADVIRKYFEVLNPLDDQPSVYVDLLLHALQSVQWDDIAMTFYE